MGVRSRRNQTHAKQGKKKTKSDTIPKQIRKKKNVSRKVAPIRFQRVHGHREMVSGESIWCSRKHSRARPSLPRKERLCSHHSDHTQLSYSPVWHGPHPGMLYHCCTVSQTTCLLPASSSSIRKVFGRWRKPRLRLRAISRFPQLACGGAPVRPKMSALLLEES